MSKSDKTYCERYKNHLRCLNNNSAYKTVKKVIVSQKISSARGNKSFSTGGLNSNRDIQVTTPKRTAKSDLIYDQNPSFIEKGKFCKNCGDVASNFNKNSKSNLKESQNLLQNVSRPRALDKNINRSANNKFAKTPNGGNKPIEQYYKNEKFNPSTETIYATDKTKKASKESLNTITEQPEQLPDSKSTIFQIYPEKLDEQLGFMDPDDVESIEKLKLFRKNNYFECHSVKSRLCSSGSVTSLNNHKCVYRFYLNDRLFPVPLNMDYQENIRCIECSLPLQNDCNNAQINGTVQAKVKLNGQVQDMLLMLPVNNSLIVTERRKVLQNKKDYDSLYFGIIKLDLNGDSKFNRNVPSNSLALKYQKGYKELTANKKYEYDCVGDDDIIII